MYVHGSFVNQKGDTVEVQILTNNSRAVTYEIGTDKSGIYFADDPIEIEDETNDVFDVVLSQSARIRLLVSSFISDFFQLNVLEAKVNIKCAGRLVFAGYIEPQTYSQDFNEVYDELELTCIDALSALQYSQYKGVADSADYALAKAEAEQVNARTLICDLVNQATSGLIIDSSSTSCPIYYDGTVQTATEHKNALRWTSINELLFFDDDEDSIWSNEDVLTEVLRYFNLHIRQDGAAFYIFDWNTAKSNAIAASNWYNINVAESAEDIECSGPSASTITLASELVEDTGTQISVEEAYNQIQLTCSRKEISEIAVSPLDEDTLVAPFPRRTLYCRELVAFPEDQDDYSYNKWSGHVRAGLCDMYNGNYITDTNLYKIYDYYVQVFRSTNWKLCGVNYSSALSAAYEENDVYDVFNANEHSLLNAASARPSTLAESPIVPCIVKVSKSKAKRSWGEDVKEFSEEATYLVIPVRGACYRDGNTSDKQCETLQARGQILYDHGGLVKCVTSTAGGSLSPADSETTNYIVIEGSVLLSPPFWSTYEDKIGDGFGDEQLPSYKPFTTCSNANDLPGGIRDYEERYDWFTTKEGETAGAAMYWFNPDGSRKDFRQGLEFSFLPPFEGQTALPFNYNADCDDWDTIDKVPILDCRMKVGDKYCVETFEDYTDTTGHKRTRSIMQWLTEAECPRYSVKDYDGVARTYVKNTFSIGIDPDIGSNIIGAKHDIANTLLATDNIDAKGTAIPIKASDRLSGKVEFAIIGPVNGVWNQTYSRHPLLYKLFFGAQYKAPILDYVSCIYISGFKIGLYSDNGKVTSGEDKDLVYMSDEDTTYRNLKECDDFKINTALSTDECIALGVANQVCLSTPTNDSNGAAVLQVYNKYAAVEAKPEQFYVDAYYNECRKPKIKMEQNMQDAGCTHSLFDTYIHPALPGKQFFIVGAGRNLMEGSIKLNLREI